MSTGSKVVLLLSFVFIGVLVWYYGPSSTTTDQIIEDPVLQQSSPVVSVDTRPEPRPAARATNPTVARSGSSVTVPRPQSPMGPMPRPTASLAGSPSYLVMGQPVATPAPAPAPAPAPVSPAAARLRAGSGSTSIAASPTPAATSIARTVEVKPAAAARTYVVAAGDTLSGISVTYYGTETQWNRIADANPDVDPDRLRIGTSLKIPAYTPRSSRTARPASASAASRPLPPGTRSHRVEDGESLSSIADQYYGRETQWTRIFEANRDMLKGDPDRLRIGMVLAIPGR